MTTTFGCALCEFKVTAEDRPGVIVPICGEHGISNCITMAKNEKKPIEIMVPPEDATIPQMETYMFTPEIEVEDKKRTLGTTVEVKRANFQKFADLLSNQFNHGGDKYKLQGFEDREATDVISSVFGGESEFDWVLGTMMKYLFRFKNFHREKDLLKIATYCYILWLKQGNHLRDEHDQDVSK